MREKKLLYIISSLFIFSLLISYPTTATLSPYIGISVGDTFEFQFSKFNLFREINGSLVIEEEGTDLVGNKIAITINEIMEANDGFFKELHGESTYLNVTENYKGTDYVTESYLDGWWIFYYQVEMAFDYWIVYFDPEGGINTGLEAPDTSDYELFAGVPAFATTNTTFYQSLESEIPDYSGTPSMPPDRSNDVECEELFLNNRLAQASLEDNTFQMNVTNEYTMSGETSSNESWSIEGMTNCYVEVNTKQGVVDKLTWLISYNLVLGSTTDDFIYEIEIDNLNPGVTVSIDFQLYHGLLLFSLGLLIYIFKRRRAN